MKILVAVPTYETIFPDTFKSIYDMDKGDHEIIFEFVRGYDVATARNKIAIRAKELQTDYVLMVDNDVVLPKDALLNLLEGDLHVCLGYYAHRNKKIGYDGKTSVCRLGEYNYTDQITADEMKILRESGRYKYQIHGGGMGCALLKTVAFDYMKFPYFRFVTYTDHGVLSEDLFFCEQCKENHVPIFVDSRVGCGHIFRYIQNV